MNPETTNFLGSATYSPEDNKLRFYPFSRLSCDDYKRVQDAGFSWAPKQQLFVAPMWTPQREDFLTELSGEIGDEDKSLCERAEERAGRFENYSEKRAGDAESARAGVERITDGIPMGQPILVGHHSETHARRDAEKIENGMRRAVKMWETSKYWVRRAQGAVRAAKYKELPGVRARRIKKLGADLRRHQRTQEAVTEANLFWGRPGLTLAEAITYAARESGVGFRMPHKEGDRPDFDQRAGAWEALSGHYPSLYAPRTLGEVVEVAMASFPRQIEHQGRWIAHYENRIAYETAMLAEQGASDLIAPKARPEQLPLCNYRQAQIKIPRIHESQRGELETLEQIELASEDFMRIWKDQRGTRICENSHRIRIALLERDNVARRFPGHQNSRWVAVFLADSKTHKKPAAITYEVPNPEFPALVLSAEPDTVRLDGPSCPNPKCQVERGKRFDDMKDSLKAGIKVVTAPQLFPTPPAVARRMVEIADVVGVKRILEPSAGTGNLLVELAGCSARLVGVEINPTLAHGLRSRFDDGSVDIRCADFLQCNGDLGKFDRVLMNPPFADGADIRHIKHALGFLRPGGKLVAICAGGPRQEAVLQPLADSWELLPEDTFENQGTNVRTVLLTITAVEGGAI